MTHTVEEYTHKGCNIEIMYDDSPSNPRTEWDNQFTMVCFHSRYTLGDKDGLGKVQDMLYACPKFNEWWIDFANDEVLDLDDPHDLSTALDRCGFITLPLYLYDHSGLTMNTRGFHCPWDSGQVGIIVADPALVRKEHGWKRLSSNRRKEIRKWMQGEVKTYDQFLTGDVYGYVVTHPDSDGHEDSDWGFYGLEFCKQQAEEAAGWVAGDVKRAKQSRLKTWIRHHVPLEVRCESA